MSAQQGQASARPPSPRPHVWICTYERRDGTDIWACATEASAYRELARICREFWEEAREVEAAFPEPVDGGPLAAEPPVDDRAAVELYFAAMNEDDPGEWFMVDRFEVIGAEEAGR